MLLLIWLLLIPRGLWLFLEINKFCTKWWFLKAVYLLWLWTLIQVAIELIWRILVIKLHVTVCYWYQTINPIYLLAQNLSIVVGDHEGNIVGCLPRCIQWRLRLNDVTTSNKVGWWQPNEHSPTVMLSLVVLQAPKVWYVIVVYFVAIC